LGFHILDFHILHFHILDFQILDFHILDFHILDFDKKKTSTKSHHFERKLDHGRLWNDFEGLLFYQIKVRLWKGSSWNRKAITRGAFQGSSVHRWQIGTSKIRFPKSPFF
jgi:hypothetical protein